jgi:DNA-binding CsgD family transcriptional regulator
MDEARLHRAIAEIYDRCLDPGRMSGVGGVIEGALGIGSSIHFVSEQAEGRMVRLLSASANFDEDARRDYALHYHDRNVWFQRARPRPPPVVARGEELIEETDFLRSEFGADWCPRVGIFHMMGCTYPLPGGLIGGSGVHRTRRQGPFDAEGMRIYGLLMQHFANAVGLLIRLELQPGRERVAQALVESLELGAILVQGDRRVVHANRVAEAVLRRGRWLTTVDGRLRTVHHGSLGALSLRIAAAARTALGQGTDPGAVLRLPAPGEAPLPLLIAPFRGGDGQWGPLQPTVILLFRDPECRVLPCRSAIAEAYGLSPAESRLVALLMDGNSLTEAAGRAGISLNTAKSQLRSIFVRTGFSRQAELVAEIRGNPLLQVMAPRPE